MAPSNNKPSKRDDFSRDTKRRLAQRVAYRCSFPDCGRVTIGPAHTQDKAVANLGTAAHIHAAAIGGPRYLPDMTEQERKSIKNGIWMCSHHARLIDTDHVIYSAPTLKLWKQAAEDLADRHLRHLDKDAVPGATTFICLNLDVMFEGIWKSAKEDTWTFLVKKIVFGDEQRLREFGPENAVKPMLNYIIVESQGDGRLIKDIRWDYYPEPDDYELTLQVLPKAKRRTPTSLGSDKARAINGQIIIENGESKTVSGIDLAKQLIELNLSLPLGGWRGNLLLGSYFSMFYHKFQGDPELLNRIIKMEITRLVNIPAYQADTPLDQPELNFISRIIDVRVFPETGGTVPLYLSLEWGDGTYWADTLHIRLYNDQEENDPYEVPDFVKGLFEENPLSKLKRLLSSLNGEEVTEQANDAAKAAIFNEAFPGIIAQAEAFLKTEIYPLFISHKLYRSIDNIALDHHDLYDPEKLLASGHVRQIGITVRLNGLKSGSFDAFDVIQDLYFYFKDYHYEAGGSRSSIWLRHPYRHAFEEKDIQVVTAKWMEAVTKEITRSIELIPK